MDSMQSIGFGHFIGFLSRRSQLFFIHGFNISINTNVYTIFTVV